MRDNKEKAKVNLNSSKVKTSSLFNSDESSSGSDPFSLKANKAPKKVGKKVAKSSLFSSESDDGGLFTSLPSKTPNTRSGSKLSSKLSLFSDDDDFFEALNASEDRLKKSKVKSKSVLESASFETQKVKSNESLLNKKVS